jgi:soluble lytic murein transglycosylase-like protein
VREIVFLLAAVPAFAGEFAVLHTGFRLAVQRHERAGDTVRLITATGVIEMPSASVAAFEPDDAPVPPPPAPAVIAAAPAPAPVQPSPQALVKEAAERYGLPPAFLHSVAKAESGFQPGAISPKGAIGIMQLMPGTAAELNANPHDPAENVDAGARHLRDLLLQYDGSTHRALAAYNAGPGAVARYNGVPPYAETRGYVEKVLQQYLKTASAPASTVSGR